LGRAAFADAARRQAAHLGAADPVAAFFALLAAVLSGGRGHVAARRGGEPDRPVAWGWREVTVGTGGFQRTDWQPQGQCVGWIDGDNLYLEPEVAYAAVQRLAGEQGASLTVTQRTLFGQMNEQGLLLSRDDARDRLTVRKRLQGGMRAVLHVAAETVLSQETGDHDFRINLDDDPAA
jgi:hypothetical protein